MSRRRITSHDVARLAGVSQSAVSRAFRTGTPLSEDLRTKVVRAAADLGYTPNAFARGLLHRRTGLVGLLVEDAAHPLQAALIARVLLCLEDAGLTPLVASARDEGALASALSRLEAFRPDGVMVCGPTLPPALGTRLKEDGVPVVLLNRYPRNDRGPAAALTDNQAGGAEMARYLLSLGHRRFGIVTGPPHAPAGRERVAGFAKVLLEAGVEGARSEPGDYSPESGMQAAGILLRSKERPTALFCCNDLMALGALAAAREFGLGVPGDLSIAGFDGIAAGTWTSPGLTTVVQDLDTLAEAAVDLLVSRLETPGLPGEIRMVPATLVVRGSTKQLTR